MHKIIYTKQDKKINSIKKSYRLPIVDFTNFLTGFI